MGMGFAVCRLHELRVGSCRMWQLSECMLPDAEHRRPPSPPIRSAATGGLTLEQQQAMLEEARQRAEAAASSGESSRGC